MKMIKKIFVLLFMYPLLINGIYLLNETSKITRNRRVPQKATEWTEPDGLFSSLLEEWTLREEKNDNHREGKILQATHKYIPTSGFYITKRIGEAIELEPHMRPPGGKVISTPTINMPMRQNYANIMPSAREVSETDLYLLGAIEKLVYRVDYMEKRLMRAEQLIYYLMAGNTQREDPCPENYTRVGEFCYHFGVNRDLNWKSANNMCRSLGGHLAEFDGNNEKHDIQALLLNHPNYRGKDFWLGGLNPGLLWIWSHTAKPINPNANLTTISGTNNSNNSTKIVNKPLTANKDKDTPEISGTGRCLRLSYNPSLHNYGYTGHDCSARLHYICEYKDSTLDNEIQRIAKELYDKN